MSDITYCGSALCPFHKCERHRRQLEGRNPKEVVSIANVEGTCRKYIGWVLERVRKKQK